MSKPKKVKKTVTKKADTKKSATKVVKAATKAIVKSVEKDADAKMPLKEVKKVEQIAKSIVADTKKAGDTPPWKGKDQFKSKGLVAPTAPAPAPTVPKNSGSTMKVSAPKKPIPRPVRTSTDFASMMVAPASSTLKRDDAPTEKVRLPNAAPPPPPSDGKISLSAVADTMRHSQHFGGNTPSMKFKTR